MIDLKNILQKNPGCLSSRAGFKSILTDVYPNEKRLINILTIIYESGLVNTIRSKKTITSIESNSFMTQIENEYGIPPKYSLNALIIWATAYDVNVQIDDVNVDNHHIEHIVHDPSAYQPVHHVGAMCDYELNTLSNGTVEIKKFRGFEEEQMIVPNQVDGKRVVGIANGAYEDCKQIKSVIVSDGIIYIDDSAFCNCTNLCEVRLPHTLERLGSLPESRRRSYLSSDPTCIGDTIFSAQGVFSGCALVKIKLPPKLSVLGQHCFFGCQKLNEIDLPNNIEAISEFCFGECTALRKVTLPDGLKSIGKAAFRNCSALASISIPNQVTSIDYYAFQGCRNLSSIRLNEGLLKIGGGAFVDCISLTEVTIPRSVQDIGLYAFSVRKGSFHNNIPNLVLCCYAGSYGVEFARKNAFSLKNAAK